MKFLVSALVLGASAAWTIENERYGPAYHTPDDFACPTCHYDPATKLTTVNYASTSPAHENFHCHRDQWVDGYDRKLYPTESVSCTCYCQASESTGFGEGRTLGGNYLTEFNQHRVDLSGVGHNNDFAASGEPARPVTGAGPTATDMVNDSPFGYCTNKAGQVSDANRNWHIFPGRVENIQQCANVHNLGSGGVLFNPNIPAPYNNCLLCPYGYGYTTAAADYTGNANSMSIMNEAETGDRSTSDPTLRASWQHVAYPMIWKCSNFEAASCERYDGGQSRYGSRVSVRSEVDHRDQYFNVADQDACSAACLDAVKYNREPLGAEASTTDYCCAWNPDDGDSRGNCHVRIADDNYSYKSRPWTQNGDPAAQDNEYKMPTPTYYQDSLAVSKFWMCADDADGYSRDENDICTQGWWGNMFNGYPRACGPGPSDQPYCYWRNSAKYIKGMDAFSRAENMDGDWNMPYGWFGFSCAVRTQPGNRCTPYSDDNWETLIPSHQHNSVGYVDKLRMPSRGAETIKAQSCMGMPLEVQMVFNDFTWDGVVANALQK